LSILITLPTCEKEILNGEKFAGVYDVYKYELKYYSNKGTVLDRTHTETDLGTLSLLFEHPDLEYHSLSYNLVGGRFAGWSFIPSNTPITWAPVTATDQQLIFSNAPAGNSAGEISLVTYTVDYLMFDKQT
jgi:hypothetical protein